MAQANLARLVCHVGHGALWLVSLGQPDHGVKSLARYSFFQKNGCKSLKLVKIIGNSLLIRKMCMTYQNVQKNMLYILVSISCMLK
jgi:hypothetical protein